MFKNNQRIDLIEGNSKQNKNMQLEEKKDACSISKLSPTKLNVNNIQSWLSNVKNISNRNDKVEKLSEFSKKVYHKFNPA